MAELREQGHSLRAIAGAVGTSLGSVQRDLAAVSVDTPAETRGRDGKLYPARRPPVSSFDPDDDEAELFAPGEEDAIADELAAALDAVNAGPPPDRGRGAGAGGRQAPSWSVKYRRPAIASRIRGALAVT